MDTTLTPIGNSKGIRIPAAVCKELAFEKNQKLHLKIENGKLIISKVQNKPKDRKQPKKNARLGWEKAFKAACTIEDDPELRAFLDMPNDADDLEWTW